MSDKAWKGQYFGPDGFLAEMEAKYECSECNRGALASAYYSAATNARASGDETGFKAHLAKAVEMSDSFMAERGENMTAEEFDVRQSILRKAGRLDEALEAIEQGLQKTPDTHTKALLLLGKVGVLIQQKNAPLAQSAIAEVERLAPEVAQHDKLQATRIYRGLARFYKEVGDSEKLDAAAREAERLIDETGAEDQRIKLKKDLA